MIIKENEINETALLNIIKNDVDKAASLDIIKNEIKKVSLFKLIRARYNENDADTRDNTVMYN